MKISKLLLGLSLAVPTVVGAGVFSKTQSKTPEVVDATSVTKSRIVFEIEDQCWATNDGRNPALRIYNITVDSSMEYNANTIADDLRAANAIDDFESGAKNYKQINADGSIDSSFTWEHQTGNKRYWSIRLPWYITGCSFKVFCNDYWSSNENTVSAYNSYMLYLYGAWDNWQTSCTTGSSISNTYSVDKYTIVATPSGGAGGCDAELKGNGGDWCHSGEFFARQKISLRGTPSAYSSFDHWTKGDSVLVSNNYDYIGTNNDAYIGHFLDLRSKYTVTFKDEDGTTLETQSNIYQGSSVTCSVTPTKADDGSKVYTFSHWVDSNGVDKTSALADLQSNLTVFASYSVSYKAGFYIYGDFGVSPTWAVETAYLMTEFSEASYAYSVKATVHIPYGSVFKLRYYNTAWYNDQEFDTRNVQNDSPALYCYDCSRNDHAFQCYAGGTYTIILHNFQNQGKTIYINFENSSRNAEQLAAYVMKFGANPESGHCGDNDRFPAARTMYLNNLNASEKSKFQGFSSSGTAQFKNGYDRYTSWARALGQDPWSNAAASSAKLLLGVNSEKTNMIMVIVVISLVSVTAIGGYFFIKRKENN